MSKDTSEGLAAKDLESEVVPGGGDARQGDTAVVRFDAEGKFVVKNCCDKRCDVHGVTPRSSSARRYVNEAVVR
jgi:hypothetical protein